MGCKLTRDQIEEIRSSDLPLKDFVKKFGVCFTTVWKAASQGKEYKRRREVKKIDEKENFMRRVKIIGKHWIWQGKPDEHGYGRLRHPVTSVVVYAHRYAYELFIGPIPDGMNVLHKHEGLPICVNPECLKVGDQQENLENYVKVFKRCYSGKMTIEKVREIRASSLPIKKLELLYGISHTAIWNIKHGVTWKEEQK
jgi:HNH endonuclease